MNRVSSMSEVHASQYFELIEDPLLNMLVPVLVQIMVDLTKQVIIQREEEDEVVQAWTLHFSLCFCRSVVLSLTTLPVLCWLSAVALCLCAPSTCCPLLSVLCFMLVPFLMDLIAFPMAAGLWPGVSASAVPGSAGLAGYESAKTFGSSSTTTTTTEVVEEMAFLQTASGDMDAFFLQFGGCDMAQSEEGCAQQLGQSGTRCAWCVHVHAHGVVSKCVPCSGSANVTVNDEPAFTCGTFEDQCAAPEPAPAPSPAAKPADPAEEEPEAPNETAATIAAAVNDAVFTQLANALPVPVGAELRQRLPGAVSRAVSRVLTTSLSRALLKTCSESLTVLLRHSLAVVSTKVLTAELTESITVAVAPGIAVSLTHDPAADTYCRLCDTHDRYCPPCHASRDHDAWVTAVATHTAQQYGRHYGAYFAAGVE